MQKTVAQDTSRGRLARTLCDVMGVLFGMLFLVASLWILDADNEPNIDFDTSIEGVVDRGLIVATLLCASICLTIPTRLYGDRRLRISGQLAASMTSAAMMASIVLPLVVLLLLCVIDPPSPGSPADDGGGVLLIVSAVIGLAAFLIFLPCTYILARKAGMRLVHLAIGTVVAGVAGGLLGYLC